MTRVTRRENKTAQNDSTGSSVSREKSGLWRCLRRPSRAPFLRGSTRTPITPGATKPRAWTLCLKPGVNQRIKFYLPSGSLTTTLPFLLSPPLPLSPLMHNVYIPHHFLRSCLRRCATLASTKAANPRHTYARLR